MTDMDALAVLCESLVTLRDSDDDNEIAYAISRGRAAVVALGLDYPELMGDAA